MAAEVSEYVVSAHFHAEGTAKEVVKLAELISEIMTDSMQAYSSLHRDLHGEDIYGDHFKLIGTSVAKVIKADA